MIIRPSVIDYQGKYENGIIVNIGLMVGEDYFDGTLFYTNMHLLLTVDENFTNKHGAIEHHEDYFDVLDFLINSVEPYDDIYNQLGDVEQTKS